MTKMEFTKRAAREITAYLPADFENAEIKLEEVRKLNSSYTALIVRPQGCLVAPSIDLNSLYAMTEDGASFDSVMKIASSLAQRRKPDCMDAGRMQEYETVKNKLFIRICDAEKNKIMLEDVPHQTCCGLAVTYHVLVSEEDEKEEVASAMVTNSLLAQYGISKEQLHHDAVASSTKLMPAAVTPLEKIIQGMLGMEDHVQPETLEEQLKEINFETEFMIVVSNRAKINGASAIFYPGLLAEIGKRMKKSFFILPSSIHEVILVPDNGKFDVSDFRDMVKSINASEVQEKDRLSNNVFRFCVERGEISLA